MKMKKYKGEEKERRVEESIGMSLNL